MQLVYLIPSGFIMVVEMPANKHVVDLIPEFALGLLDEADATPVHAHLELCAACQAELAAYLKVVEQLPLAVPMMEPPAHLKDEVLTRVRPTPRSEEPERRSWWQEMRTVFQRSTPALAGVSLVLVILLGIINLVLWNQVRELTQAAQEPAMRVVSLASTDNLSEASGIMIISKNGKYGTLVVDDLPELDHDKQYQLWLIRDGERTSGGVFSVYSSGYAVMEIDAPEPLSNYPAFGITIEPAGGSPAPTGDRVLSGEL